MGLHTTWGVFTYPLIFIITDLTVRISSAGLARRVVLRALIPGLLVSYFLTTLFSNHFDSAGLFHLNTFAFRIALASFSAYLVGQLLDISVFQSLRKTQRWWVAPTASSLLGNTLDTFWFFFIAFYQSSDPFFAAHWFEIAMVDLGFKLSFSLLSFIPLYGVLLKWLSQKPQMA